jgi:phosphatidylinositol alpha 1,6-mannosyltransferase
LPRSTGFTGMLRGEALAQAFAKMDVFLFPSLSDTFGLVVLEAMSSGVPVVSFKVCGPNSVVQDGVNGFSAQTSADFVAGVEQLVNRVDLRERMGLAARRTALSQNWDSVFTQVYESYTELLSVPSVQPAFAATT